MKKLHISVLILTLFTSIFYSQTYKFGDVSVEELQSKSDKFFPEADAVILYREVKASIGKTLRVFERIKIYNEEGFEYSTVRIPYSNVKGIKAVTYNLVNGKIEETKLDKKLLFTDEEVKGRKIKKFTFPKVKAGSVLELTYYTEKQITSDIYLQYYIPIKKIRVEVNNSTLAKFKLVQNPRAFQYVTRRTEGATTIISHKNIPALEEENYVYDIDLYRSKLEFNWGGWSYSLKLDTWESLINTLYEIDEFSNSLKPKKFYKEEVDAIIKDEKDLLKQTKAIYKYLKSEITWNKNYSYFPDIGIKKTFKDKEGSVADINMLLISMLRSLNIDAHPILVSTRSNGIPIIAGPYVFDYIIAGVKVNNKFYYLDAANTKSTFDYLPESLLNWNSRLIKEDGSSYVVNLTNPAVSNDMTMVNATIDEDFYINGSAREKRTGYHAIRLKSKLNNLGENQKEDIISFDYMDMEVSGIKLKHDDMKNNYVIDYNFDIENAVDEIDGKLYLSPLLFLSIQENPFTKEEREYPIDFGFPKKYEYLVNIKLPEGYTITHIPKTISIQLPDDLGSYVYLIKSNGNSLQVQAKLKINTSMMSKDRYLHLKEFYMVRMEKENEKIILEKK